MALANSVSTTARQSDLGDSLNMMNKGLDALHERIAELEAALSPVLRSQGAEDQGTNPQAPRHSASAVAFVDDLNMTLSSAIRRLSSIYERLAT